MTKILTICVPTYNMEGYLRKCLGSMVVGDAENKVDAEKMADAEKIADAEVMRDLEVVVVNDGSSDGSSEIAHEYEREYPDTFRVIDKENGQYGSCVNRTSSESRDVSSLTIYAESWLLTTVKMQRKAKPVRH